MTYTPHREAGIELGRIFCCFCVIVIHINSFYSAYPAISFIWTMAKCAATPVFFLITGFFFSPDKPFKTYLSRLFARIIIPTILILLAIAQLTPWLSGQTSLNYCFTHLQIKNFILVGKILLTFWPYDYLPDYNPFISLWFTFSLILCYLAFPLLKMLCSQNQIALITKKYILWLGLIFFVGRVTLLVSFPDNPTIQHIDWWIQEKPFYWLWLILLGHHLSIFLKNRLLLNRFRSILVIGGSFTYLFGSFIIFWLTMHFNVDSIGDVNQRFFVREFVFYLAAQLGVFILFTTLPTTHAGLNRLILFIADKTFYIYMIHEAVYKKLLLVLGLSNVITVSGYLGFAALSFIVSLLVACGLKNTERLVTNGLSHLGS
ncbi:MAG: hypothetical protein AMR96_04550 [Candidatus Adiutrix intracellularis]|jgi:surface polysaccharide O-acyltransferase-like enzyme|nr:MAG: hypothetical protein AMR96_04550 [Candidatus Adiutrix intracellularis]MDR2827015.1 acyltransferase [Candidatus Adiutrix intracellularis]